MWYITQNWTCGSNYENEICRQKTCYRICIFEESWSNVGWNKLQKRLKITILKNNTYYVYEILEREWIYMYWLYFPFEAFATIYTHNLFFALFSLFLDNCGGRLLFFFHFRYKSYLSYWLSSICRLKKISYFVCWNFVQKAFFVVFFHEWSKCVKIKCLSFRL